MPSFRRNKATFNGTMLEPAREDLLISDCKRYMAEAIRKHDSNAEAVVERMVAITQGPSKNLEALSLLQNGTLVYPMSDPDPVRGMSRCQMIWKVQGMVNGQPGIYPAYQVELLVAEYPFGYVSLEKKLVGLKWESPVSIR